MSNYCENCNCPQCYAQRTAYCVDCRLPFLGKNLNQYYRCAPCEKEHALWLLELEDKRSHSLQGEWGRHAKAEKDAFSKDLLQPRNKDGTINKHFVEVNGTRAFKKEMKLSKKEFSEQGGYG